jgi:hypothetical protein
MADEAMERMCFWREYTLLFSQCQQQPIPFSSTEFRQNAGAFCGHPRANCNRNQSVTQESELLIADLQESYSYICNFRVEGMSWFRTYTGISTHSTKLFCHSTFDPAIAGPALSVREQQRRVSRKR